MDFFNFNHLGITATAVAKTKILVVDDDPKICQSITEILKSVGLQAYPAAGGREALNYLNRESFSLVILDLNMPEVDGIEIINHINRNAIDCAIIVVSGESEFDIAVHVLKNGAKDFIKKPYAPDELLFSIKNVLEKRFLEITNRGMVEKIKESEALHKFIVHNSPDILFMLDKNGFFTFINRNIVRTLGYAQQEVIGKHYTDFVHPKDINRAKFFFGTQKLPKNTKSVEIRLLGKDNKAVTHVEVRTMQVEKSFSGGYKLGIRSKNKDGDNFVGTYGVARDITGRKRSEEIIRFQHNHDLLTGLPNRNLLNERASVLVSHAQRNNERLAVLFIDIDRFKRINDSYGLMVGDELLQSVSTTLKRCTRAGDILARIGGDEFILLLPAIKSQDDAIAVANKIIQETSAPYIHNNTDIHITLSIGIAIYPEHGTTKDQLIKNADIAVCQSKSITTSNYCTYNKSLKSSTSNKILIEKMIRKAIKNDQILINYQPQINLETGALHAVEALVRINSPDRGTLLPGQFIDTAEESNLINELGDIVIEKVCQDMLVWNSYGHRVPTCINISAVQLSMDGFADHIIKKIRAYDLDLDVFELEITENILIQNMDMTLGNIIKLSNCGINFAIDDFGTGYSSLSYLDQLPLHTLKLDKSFIKRIIQSTDDNTIIPAMINVSNGLKMNFIAEGVENRAQHEYLKSQGSCIAQGFFYSEPIPSVELLDFIENLKPEKFA